MRTAQFHLHAQIEDCHWWFVARRQILHALLRAVVPAGEDVTVVDVGCGTGANLGSLAGDYNCVGVDTSLDAVRLARQRFPSVQFVHGFAPWGIQDALERSRAVMLTDVLEHVEDDFELFSEVLAATPVGAYVLLTVPAELSLWSRHDESFGHYRRYDVERLSLLWQDMPVAPVLTSYYNSRLYPAVRSVRWLGRRLGRTCGAAETDFHMPPLAMNRLLTRIFSSEGRRLVRSLGTERLAFKRGVSLIALLRREPGHVDVRTRPAHVARDVHRPHQELACAGAC